MAIYFPPPEPPAIEEVRAECEAVYDEVVEMAAPRVIEAARRAREKADSGTDGDDDGEAQAANDGDSGFSLAGGRRSAIRDAGLSVGAQAGLHYRYTQIGELVETETVSGMLDQAFRFSRMVTEDNVIYPVISEARRSFTVAPDGQSARSSRMTWRIITPAQIVSTPPNWRMYLRQSTSDDYTAPQGLMPHSAREQRLWRSTICEGFRQGVQQANRIFRDRMTRLVRDFVGMLRYRRLAQQNIVSEPKVAEGRMGVRIEADGEKVYVDDRMIRISETVRFVESSEWEAIRSMPADEATTPAAPASGGE